MNIITTFLFVCFCSLVNAQAPKIIADGTITYTILQTVDGNQITSGSKVVYIKGKDIRTDLITPKFSQTVLYDSREGKATVMKNIGQSKYISYYNEDDWRKKNEKFKDATISLTGKSKSILNYSCEEAVLRLTNGDVYTIYFTPSFIPSIDENPFLFKNVHGLVLEFQSTDKKEGEIIYRADKINFDPVPSAQFEISVKGYRLITN
ncbi:MAG: hypothetical protein JST21_11725 [Bacteroidetes bacterium]|nr:hypothetical protein [Bacteroidota bacterium]